MNRFEKDFRHLSRQINSLSNGQARVSIDNIFKPSTLSSSSNVSDSDESLSIQSFYIEISPCDGPYAHGSFIFRIEACNEYNYPELQPIVSCLTRIYHPNIDTTYRNRYNNVCVSTLSDWDSGGNSTLEDLLQALMFLFYSPEIDDPLTLNISTNEKDFLAKFSTSIEGGLIDDFECRPFEMNYGYRRYLMEQEEQQEEQLDDRLIKILTRELDFKQIFTADTLEFLMNTSASSIIHSTRHNKETLTNT
jgi:ubiquitin-conjugating enzyme E2 M